MSKKEEYNVVVLNRANVTTYPKLGVAVVNVAVTYIAAGLPPHTIYLPKKDFTPAKEKEAIRKDIEERLKVQPESYKV